MGNASQCVLVTGASGFVGRALIRQLAASGWHVRAAARDPTGIVAGPRIEPVRMPDMSGPADWRPLVAGVTHVVHLAGIAHSRAHLPDSVYMRVNADAAWQLAAAAKSAGITRFVLMSSVRAQSGTAATTVLNELTSPAPTDAYGRSKLAAEAAIAAELGASAISLRPVLIMGRGVKGNLAALQRLARLPVPLPFGAVHNRRSLLGLQNLSSIVGFALTSPNAGGKVFLAADPEPISLAQLVAAMRAALGLKPGIINLPPALLRRLLLLAGKNSLAASLLADLEVDIGALTIAGWRPVSTRAEEIARMMRA